MKKSSFYFKSIIFLLIIGGSLLPVKSHSSQLTKSVKHFKQEMISTWYVFTGAQTPVARATKTNYVRTSVNPVCSPGTANECAVLLNADFGVNPISAIMSFDLTTGMPIIAGDVLDNRTKGF